MKNYDKYKRQYYMPGAGCLDWTKKEYIDKAPTWCSVDLRDGNQALIVPMSLEKKLEFWKLLLKLGFKEIEVGFPAASETEYEFVRALIDGGLIPDDVTIQVLMQSREHIIRKTFDSLKGAKRAIVHLYNPTSYAQRTQVFKKTDDEVETIAVKGAALCKKLASKSDTEFIFEYSPESFTGTEPEYALKVCNAVLDVWQPSPENKVIINLPATVELSMPHVYASQVEYISKGLNYRENVILSLHPHNDRGSGVADAEMGLLAGAERIEGTLFGNGERTGNVDIVTLALNMFSHGVDPKLDFSNLPEIAEIYESVTGMPINERQPYSGKLVFAAFSGSHQDAIAKSIKWRRKQHENTWSVPYLPIDPADVGREYETDVIRINSQSGKGGIGYLLETNYGFELPAKMREIVGYTVKNVSDHMHKELSPKDVLDIFTENFININEPLGLIDFHYVRDEKVHVTLTVNDHGTVREIKGTGNGRLDSVSNAIKENLGINYSDLTYSEHALSRGSSSQAITYLSITLPDGSVSWGAGVHDDIIASSVNALFSAINRIGVVAAEK